MIVIKTKKNVKIFSLNESQAKIKIWIKGDGNSVDIDTIKASIEAVMQDLAQYFPSIEMIMKHKDIILTDNPNVKTMATDGISIFINPAYAEYLINMDEDKGLMYLEFVLIHEALHILFDHCNKHADSYNKFSDAEKVNYAQDYEINYIIENFLRQGPGTSPFKGVTKALKGCYSDEFGKKGLTWEEIYERLSSFKRTKKPERTSDEWKNGFADGYADVMDSLRKQKLIERYEL